MLPSAVAFGLLQHSWVASKIREILVSYRYDENIGFICIFQGSPLAGLLKKSFLSVL
jgi:hypothetical protein